MGEERHVLRRLASDLGFDLVGIASAEPFAEARQIALARLRQGLLGELSWYSEARVLRGTDPQAVLPSARSIIAVALNYIGPDVAEHQLPPLHGRVARYAWGRDYHNVLKKRLRKLVAVLSERVGRPVRARIYVDDGPTLDREVARRAGIGFFGKNTNIFTEMGSWVFLGLAITDLPLEPDLPLRKTCGFCQACILACPTGAIVAPYVLDSRRCISYLTIEHRGPIPRDLRPLMGQWVFGCDLCQEACPINGLRARPAAELAFQPRLENISIDLLGVLSLSEGQFRARFQGSAIRRATRLGLQRNAAVALGNARDRRAVPALARALREGAPLVRGHAAWALGRIGGQEAERSLREALASEQDSEVREETETALAAVE